MFLWQENDILFGEFCVYRLMSMRIGRFSICFLHDSNDSGILGLRLYGNLLFFLGETMVILGRFLVGLNADM